LVHTIRRGIFMHTLKPRHPVCDGDTTVLQIKLSEQGRIVVLSDTMNEKDTVKNNILFIMQLL